MRLGEWNEHTRADEQINMVGEVVCGQYSGAIMSLGVPMCRRARHSGVVFSPKNTGKYTSTPHRYYAISVIRAPHDQPITPRRPHASYATSWVIARAHMGCLGVCVVD